MTPVFFSDSRALLFSSLGPGWASLGPPLSVAASVILYHPTVYKFARRQGLPRGCQRTHLAFSCRGGGGERLGLESLVGDDSSQIRFIESGVTSCSGFSDIDLLYSSIQTVAVLIITCMYRLMSIATCIQYKLFITKVFLNMLLTSIPHPYFITRWWLLLDIETKFPYFLFLTWLSIITNQEFRLYI